MSSPDPDTTSPARGVDRRTVIGSVAGGVLGAGLLTACGSPAGSTDSGAAPAAGPLGPSAGVPVGGATIFSERGVIVTQATAGRFAAFSIRCPHQGCTVAAVDGAELVCPCHDSRFDLTGAVLSGPAQSGLTSVNLTVDGDQLTVG